MRLWWLSQEVASSLDKSSKLHSQQDSYESKFVSQGDTSPLFVGGLMSLKWHRPISLSLVLCTVTDILMICFARLTYCGRWDVKVWHKGKPKTGYLSVFAK